MMLMAENERWDFILHLLCLAIIMRKWNLFGHVMYYGQLLFYITFLTLLNVHISPSMLYSRTHQIRQMKDLQQM